MSDSKAANKIVAAFVQLLHEKDYNKLTITDIARQAKVSRMSFYRNFKTKEDVISEFIDSVVKQSEEEIARRVNAKGLKDYLEVLFEIVSRHSVVIRKIYGANFGALILTRLNEQLFVTYQKNNGMSLGRYKTRFIVGAFYNVTIDWINTGMKETSAEMAEICAAIVA